MFRRLTLALAVEPFRKRLFPSEDRLAQALPLARILRHLLIWAQYRRPRPGLVATRAKLLVELDDLVDGMREDGRHREEQRDVVTQARRQGREQ